jgi:hypothetical protein
MAINNLGFGQYNPQGINGAGSNPYLQTNVNNALDSVTRNYNNTIAPQMASQFAQSKSFGNSGLQQQQTNQQRGLADSLGATAGNMYGQAYQTDRANDLAWTNNNLNNETQRYGYDQSLIGQKYASDNSLKGSMYGADRGLEGTKFASTTAASANMYGADKSAAASMYNSDNSRAASQYGADANLYGNLYSTDAGIYNNAANNATTQRGQDVQYGIAQLGNDTTRMGQGMTYDLGLRNNDLGFSTLDANIANRNFDNSMTAANFGLAVNNQLAANNGQAINAGQQINDAPLNYQQTIGNMQNSIANGYGIQTNTGANSTAANVLGGAIAGNTLYNNFAQTQPANLGFGTGSAYGNQDYGLYF